MEARLSLIAEAHEQVTASCIKDSFKKTGLYPFNPEARERHMTKRLCAESEAIWKARMATRERAQEAQGNLGMEDVPSLTAGIHTTINQYVACVGRGWSQRAKSWKRPRGLH